MGLNAIFIYIILMDFLIVKILIFALVYLGFGSQKVVNSIF